MASTDFRTYFHCPKNSANTFTAEVTNNDKLFNLDYTPAGTGSPMNGNISTYYEMKYLIDYWKQTVIVTIGYNSNLSINLSITKIKAASTRAFPLMNTARDVVGASITSDVVLWTTATAGNVRDDTDGVHGSFNCVGFPINQTQNCLDVTLSDDPINDQLKNIPLRVEASVGGSVVFSVGGIRCTARSVQICM